MKPRQKKKYTTLFNEYKSLDFEQSKLYDGVEIKDKNKWDELQVQKLAILEEMQKCISSKT